MKLSKDMVALRDRLLKRSGFNDIEKPNGDLRAECGNGRVRQYGLDASRLDFLKASVDPAAWTDRCWSAFHRMPLEQEQDRPILELLARGKSKADIAAELKCPRRRVMRMRKAIQGWRDPEDES
jgi:hypothetical protein